MANGDGSSDPEDYVLRSGVRSGLKREFAFALRAQAALPVSLGRTRSGRSPSFSPTSLSCDSKRAKKADAKDLASKAAGLPQEAAAPNPPLKLLEIEAEAPFVVYRLDEAKVEAPIVVDGQDEVMRDFNPTEDGLAVEKSSQIGVLDEAKVDGDPPIKTYTRSGSKITRREGSIVLALASSPPIEANGSVIDDNGVETPIVVDDNDACKVNGDQLENGCALEDPIVIDGQDGSKMDGTTAVKPLKKRFTRSVSKVTLQGRTKSLLLSSRR